MKKVIFAAMIVSLAGCAVAYPVPQYQGYVVSDPFILAQHPRDVVYVWDPIRFLYYFVDHRHHKHYMPPHWRHHRHGHQGDPRWEYERHQHHNHKHHGHDNHKHHGHDNHPGHGHDRR